MLSKIIEILSVLPLHPPFFLILLYPALSFHIQYVLLDNRLLILQNYYLPLFFYKFKSIVIFSNNILSFGISPLKASIFSILFSFNSFIIKSISSFVEFIQVKCANASIPYLFLQEMITHRFYYSLSFLQLHKLRLWNPVLNLLTPLKFHILFL